MRQCFDIQIGVKHRHDFFDVDGGRLEQFFADRSSQFTQVFVDAPMMIREEDPAGQRQAIAMYARRAKSHDDVALLRVSACEDSRKIDGANSGADEIEGTSFTHAADHLSDLSDLPAWNGDIAQLRAFVKAPNQLSHQVVVRPLYGNIIEQRDRSSPDCEHVINVHRDTVDTDRVVFIHHLGDKNFGAHAVGGYGDT